MLLFILYNLIIVGTLILSHGNFIPKSDDPGLIERAIQHINLSPDWSPMYLDWVRLIHHFIDSNIQIYCVILIIAVIFLALMTYITLFIISKSNQIAFFLALLLFFSPVSPIMAHFSDLPSSMIIYYALSFFLMGIAILVRFENKIVSVFSIVFFVVASLFRPEFLAAVIFVLFYFVWVIFTNVNNSKQLPDITSRRLLKGLLCSLFILGIITILYRYYGLPIPSSGRSILAFGQHFAVRYCQNYKNICIALDINQWIDWKKILPLSFSLYDQKITFLNLFINNPTAIITHVSINFIQTLTSIFSLGFFMPLFIFNSIAWKIVGLITGTLAVIGLIKYSIYYKKQLFLVQKPGIALFIVLSCIPSILAALLFFPRIHYIALIVYALLILICPVKLNNREHAPD